MRHCHATGANILHSSAAFGFVVCLTCITLDTGVTLCDSSSLLIKLFLENSNLKTPEKNIKKKNNN